MAPSSATTASRPAEASAVARGRHASPRSVTPRARVSRFLHSRAGEARQRSRSVGHDSCSFLGWRERKQVGERSMTKKPMGSGKHRVANDQLGVLCIDRARVPLHSRTLGSVSSWALTAVVVFTTGLSGCGPLPSVRDTWAAQPSEGEAEGVRQESSSGPAAFDASGAPAQPSAVPVPSHPEPAPTKSVRRQLTSSPPSELPPPPPPPPGARVPSPTVGESP